MSHTKEPLTYMELPTADGEYMVLGGEGQEYGLVASCIELDDARRIVACVNALEGLSDYALLGGWSFRGIESRAKLLENQRDEYWEALQHTSYEVENMLRNQRDELLTVIVNARNALESANEMANGPICDTIWYGPGETLFDYMDAAIASVKGDTSTNSLSISSKLVDETAVPAVVFYPAGSLGEAI